MTPAEARAVLGVGPRAGEPEIRAAYRELLFRHHPDLAGGDRGATDRTIVLNRAAAVLLGSPTEPTEPTVSTPSQTAPSPPAPASPIPASVAVDVEAADDTITLLGVPADETYLRLLDAAHRIGEVVYIDRSAGLVQVVCELADGRWCQLLLSLQGRAFGTDVFCTIESLDSQPVLDDLPQIVGELAGLLGAAAGSS